MTRVRSLFRITLTPDRVSKPALPVVIGIVRITVPFRDTVMVCVRMFTVLTMASPVRKVVLRSLSPQTPGAISTPVRRAFTVIAVLAGQ